MTEIELRQNVCDTARKWLGCKESDGSHRPIIDLYNSHKPLARGYPLQYTDSWCAGFVSAVAIECGITDILPTEVGCGKQIQRFKDLGEWVEDDAYIPAPADVIYYDWSDSGIGDNTTAPDHVGLVLACDGSSMQVIEGNYADSVKIRSIPVNGRYIRGYGCPNYASKADPEHAPEPAPNPEPGPNETHAAYKPVAYRDRADLPKWATAAAYLADSGVLVGTGKHLNVSDDMARVLEVLARIGVIHVPAVEEKEVG